VWEVVTDLESHPRWRPSVREFRQVSDGPLEVGSRIREVLEWRGREITLADEVTALDAQRRLGIRGGWKAADFDLELLLEPSGTGTSVTFDWTLRPKSLLLRAARTLVAANLRAGGRLTAGLGGVASPAAGRLDGNFARFDDASFCVSSPHVQNEHLDEQLPAS
jgi:hypothetical protein